MPTTEIVTRGKAIENSAVILTGRLRNANTGDPIIPSDVESAVLKVFDLSDNSLVIPEGADDPYDGTVLDPEEIILGDLTTGYLADDDEGYNFRIDLHGSYFPEGNRTYQVEIKLTPPDDGYPYYRLYQVKTTNIESE